VKAFAIAAAAFAVIAAAAATAIVFYSRAEEARLSAVRAESEEEAARLALKKAKAEESAAKAREEAARLDAQAALDNRKASEADREAARHNAAAAESEAARQEAARQEAQELSAAAAAERDAKKSQAAEAKAAAEKARAEEAAEAARLAAAQAVLDKERLSSERTIAEAKLFEMRQIDLASLERDLLEFKAALDEREKALRPEKTVADLQWAGEREADTIGGTTNRVRRAGKPLPENDRSKPRATRELSRVMRIVSEASDARDEELKRVVVLSLGRLRERALREDRMVDADFYGKCMETMYPGFDAADLEQKKEEEKK